MNFDLVFPDRTDWVMGKILEMRARTHANKPFLQEFGSAALTYREVDEIVNRLANGLAASGVKKGDNVLIMMPNCLEFVFIWFALNKLGAVEVPVNTAYKASFLEHVVNNSRAEIIVIDTAYVEQFYPSADKLPHLKTVVLFSRSPEEIARWRRLPPFSVSTYDRLLGHPATAPGVSVRHFDVGSILYTSGTTGPAKGVISTHAHMYMCAIVNLNYLRLTERDVYYTCQPLFHGNAQVLTVVPALIAGAKAFIGPRFSASGWLKQVRESGATVTNLQGVMTDFVFKQPPTPHDRDHRLRVVYAIPASPRIALAFKERFGLEAIAQSYGQTEIGLVIFMPYGEYTPGSSGKAVPHWYDIRLVDPDTDEPVPDGEPGELVVRSRDPWAIFSGYYGMPEETLRACRNLWYHTGDMLRRDEEGNYYFVDRTKDKIRRRAENISASEVESVVIGHPAVKECAVIAVPSEIAGGEDEVKACIVVEEGGRVTPEELLDWAEDRMPYFAVPRYIEFMGALPRTPTEKVQKQVLRQNGLNANTWDREKAGYKLKEEIRRQRARAEQAARDAARPEGG